VLQIGPEEYHSHGVLGIVCCIELPPPVARGLSFWLLVEFGFDFGGFLLRAGDWIGWFRPPNGNPRTVQVVHEVLIASLFNEGGAHSDGETSGGRLLVLAVHFDEV